MLRSGTDKDNLITQGFLVAIEMTEDVNIEHVRSKLVDAAAFVEGVGRSEVDALGVIEVVEEESKADVTT